MSVAAPPGKPLTMAIVLLGQDLVSWDEAGLASPINVTASREAENGTNRKANRGASRRIVMGTLQGQGGGGNVRAGWLPVLHSVLYTDFNY
ncbi:hypothetical protein D3C86_1555740 [compost metagenome]